MKKLIFLIALLIPMIASAQWESHYVAGDELKGVSEHYANIYHDAYGNYFVYWTNGNDIKISTKSGIFNYNNYHGVSAIVGFYDGDALVEKQNVTMYVPTGDSDTAYNVEDDFGKKVIEHLNNVGAVRFIIPKYSGADFDMKIPKRKK